ncbi:MAG: sulfur carrier protein ThiS [Candidatus Dormibacteria bacterium]
MTVIVNGSAVSVEPGTTIADLVASASRTSTGVAVALNDAVVIRSTWPTTTVQEQDRIEMLEAAQGG